MEISHPPVMVKASLLYDKLRNALGDGVDIVLLLTSSGSLMSSASIRVGFSQSQECRTLAALTANIWRTYASTQKGMPVASKNAPHSSGGGDDDDTVSELEFVLAELETNKLCCFGMGGKAVLALFAANSTELGMIKLKAASLQGELFDSIQLALRQEPNTRAF